MEFGGAGVPAQFIELNTLSILFLIVLGFLGGLTSGFIGSGGAFVLTPGMMSLGVPAPVAVASNMCHKFPKAMVGAYKRFKYGQVDVKLGLITAASAIAGVQIGIKVQEKIYNSWGAAGSDLYVSLAFVIVLMILGVYMLFETRKSMKAPETGEKTSGLARYVKQIHLPPMIKFKLADTTVSLWMTIPVGFATGMLAATIAVGGFIGVPGMIYILGVPPIVASATELVIAFTMGLSGTVTWALGGFVDIRMTLLILGGSLFGVQLGAIGTTYVKEYMVKLVMAMMMILVSVSRLMAIPIYLGELNLMTLSENYVPLLKNASFFTMCVAMTAGGAIILGSMWKRKRELSRYPLKEAEASGS
jgi:uncharacterized membrane protein YfcA